MCPFFVFFCRENYFIYNSFCFSAVRTGSGVPREGGGLLRFLLLRCTELIGVLDLASNCANDVTIL